MSGCKYIVVLMGKGSLFQIYEHFPSVSAIMTNHWGFFNRGD